MGGAGMGSAVDADGTPHWVVSMASITMIAVRATPLVTMKMAAEKGWFVLSGIEASVVCGEVGLSHLTVPRGHCNVSDRWLMSAAERPAH